MVSLRQARFFTAGVLGIVLAVLSCVQLYYDKHQSQEPLRKWFEGKSGIGVLGFVHDVDLKTRHFKVRWEVASRNVTNDSPLVVLIDQAPLTSEGLLTPNPHAQSFVLEKDSDNVHHITNHTFDGSWKGWAKSDNPRFYPFDRYSFTGHIAVMDGPTYTPVTFHKFGIGDNTATRHYSPVLALRIEPDSERTNKTEGGGLQPFGSLVERTIPTKVSVLGMFGASWILTFGVLGTLIAPLVPYLREKGVTSSWRAIRLAPLAVIVPVVFMREIATKDGRPSFNDGALIDYLGVFLQIILVLVDTVIVGIVKRREDLGRGAISLGEEGAD